MLNQNSSFNKTDSWLECGENLTPTKNRLVCGWLRLHAPFI